MKQLDYLKIADAIFSVTKDEKDQVALNSMHKVVTALAGVYQKDNPKFNFSFFEHACFTGELTSAKNW